MKIPKEEWQIVNFSTQWNLAADTLGLNKNTNNNHSQLTSSNDGVTLIVYSNWNM